MGEGVRRRPPPLTAFPTGSNVPIANEPLVERSGTLRRSGAGLGVAADELSRFQQITDA